MCTLILLDRVVPGVPIVVAANRDEFLARPAAPPVLFRAQETGRASFVAPQDLEAGGTWMGVNENGVFVGLTNRRPRTQTPGRRSRGLLVLESLGGRDTRAVLEQLGPDLSCVYSPFHLLVADGRRAALVSAGVGEERVRELDPGIHVVGNGELEEAVPGKLRRVRDAVSGIDPEAPWDRISEDLVRILSTHESGNAFESTCVHAPGYGTRSAALIAMGPARRGYWVSDGPPCRTKFTNLSRLLDDLAQTAVHG